MQPEVAIIALSDLVELLDARRAHVRALASDSPPDVVCRCIMRLLDCIRTTGLPACTSQSQSSHANTTKGNIHALSLLKALAHLEVYDKTILVQLELSVLQDSSMMDLQQHAETLASFCKLGYELDAKVVHNLQATSARAMAHEVSVDSSVPGHGKAPAADHATEVAVHLAQQGASTVHPVGQLWVASFEAATKHALHTLSLPDLGATMHALEVMNASLSVTWLRTAGDAAIIWLVNGGGAASSMRQGSRPALSVVPAQGCSLDQLASLFASLATLGCKMSHEVLQNAVAAHGVAGAAALHGMPAGALADLSWGLCTLGAHPGRKWVMAALEATHMKLQVMPAKQAIRALSMFAALQCRPYDAWLRDFDQRMRSVALPGTLDCEDLQLLLNALVTFGYKPDHQLCTNLVHHLERLVSCMSAAQLQALSYSMSALFPKMRDRKMRNVVAEMQRRLRYITAVD